MFLEVLVPPKLFAGICEFDRKAETQKKYNEFQLIVNTSTKHEAGSGFQETNLGSCVLSLVANKSISGVP